MYPNYLSLFLLILIPSTTQSFPDLPPHEDGRCRCACPQLSSLLSVLKPQNGSSRPMLVMPNRQIYVESVEPSECKCDRLVLGKLALEEPLVADQWEELQMKQKFCPRCTCRYETRNTTVIKVVVILVLWVIFILTLYMGFLLCLDPWLKRNKHMYHEQNNDEICLPNYPFQRSDDEPPVTMVTLRSVSPRPGSVLHRVGNQQSKWQRTVQEQRRNIYDRRTMLN